MKSCLTPRVTILGHTLHSGSYILGITVSRPLQIAFGRFQGGSLINIPAGEALYIGSAMGSRGQPLARRLLRHATRSDDLPPHRIQAELARCLSTSDKPLTPPKRKKLRWHIDYLLNEPQVELAQVIAIYSPHRLEADLAQLLAADSHTFILAKGLGASDAPGQTHLLGLKPHSNWRVNLPPKIKTLL